MARRFGWALGLLVPVAACSNPPPPPPAPPAPTVSDTDRSFVTALTQANLAEVQAGDLASKTSNKASIRKLGSQMSNEHSQLNEKLGTLAKAKGIDVPTQPNEQQQAVYQKLQGERASRFNNDYVDSELDSHKALEPVLNLEINQGSDADLKKLAGDTLPVIQLHVKELEALKNGKTPRRLRHGAAAATIPPVVQSAAPAALAPAPATAPAAQ
ncbi:DUF4142 domain-containing protein [Granulibacter bethesdensis]|uniref:DUF4142 domain-containing protein n=1 Tax=Granulibacter bethesdensis (strain ATCC BAA-1260 / CGDNIH1) TaxID=391165 RepID=Q0BSG9_GRABC|nr:DUF4142 domain-containing protein [Granulibacter bethesdensis]ABI62233.1 Hypothetical protein GbCGDNIH1_1335 [Granulibacter bethesdensis CGDNIH1]APH52059.1 Hypothetical protein GbCGDNIH5_1335 [Granulibacter bethesdensis]APH64750.1 Hypothetical protein GbCGDNIH1I4_1335 [Granulibacter bethesdensis]